MGLTTRTINLSEDQNIFFISDTHYNHKNICRGVSTWDLKEHGGHSSVRDFDTISKMNDAIVNDINSVVGQDDYLVHLGDWSFGGINSIWEFRQRIICQNVILVLGNHDEHIDANKQLPNCWRRYGSGNLVNIEDSHSDWDELVDAQELFSGVYGRLQLIVKRPDKSKTTYECNHFPWVVWNKAHHNRIHLYGHVHGNFTHKGRAVDVGIDNIKKLKGNFVPLSEKEIASYMKNREYQQVSHHNKNTN